MSEINENVNSLITKMKESVTMDKNTGTGSGTDKLYENNLPESLNMDLVKEIETYNTTFIAAATKTAGDISLDLMENNKSLERTTTSFPMGHKDELTVVIDRQKVYNNHLSKDAGDGKIIKHGVASVDYEVRSGVNGGQLKVVRNKIIEEANKRLG